MNDRIDFLIQCLGEKASLLEKLVLLLDEERDSIVALDTAGLENKRESKLSHIGLLEQSKATCKKALEDAAAELKVSSLINLSAVLDAAPPARREVLLKLQRRLFELTDILNRSNRFNRDLLYGSLGTVNRSLDFINSRMGRGVRTYSSAGSVVTGVAGGRLLSGEI